MRRRVENLVNVPPHSSLIRMLSLSFLPNNFNMFMGPLILILPVVIASILIISPTPFSPFVQPDSRYEIRGDIFGWFIAFVMFAVAKAPHYTLGFPNFCPVASNPICWTFIAVQTGLFLIFRLPPRTVPHPRCIFRYCNVLLLISMWVLVPFKINPYLQLVCPSISVFPLLSLPP